MQNQETELQEILFIIEDLNVVHRLVALTAGKFKEASTPSFKHVRLFPAE